MIELLKLVGKGMIFAAPVGPVTAEAIRRGLQGGFYPAFRVKIGAAFGDAILLLVVYYFINEISNETIKNSIPFVSSSLILYMGAKNVISGIKMTPDLSSNVSFHNGMKLGFGLAMTNPFALAFWVNFLADSSETQLMNASPLISCLFILIGIALWDVILCVFLDAGKNYVNSFFIKSITVAAGLLLCFLGLTYLNKAIINVFHTGLIDLLLFK